MRVVSPPSPGTGENVWGPERGRKLDLFISISKYCAQSFRVPTTNLRQKDIPAPHQFAPKEISAPRRFSS